MQRIPIGDLRIGKEEKRAISNVMRRGRITEGKAVRDFEKAFAQYIGVKGCVATSSGTGALITALTALVEDKRFPKIKRGARVVTSALSYIATANAIVISGLEPVFVDVDLETFSLKTSEITAGYPVILPVHLMGYPCEMDKINSIDGSVVFEDAAQSHGSELGGRKTGSLSHMAIFSFYVAHNIQAGEMGAIVSNDLKLLSLCRQIKAQGRLCDCKICTRHEGKCPYSGKGVDPRFTHNIIGYNFKAMEFPAAIALEQLKKVDWIIAKRQENVRYLNQSLARYSGTLQLPKYSSSVSYLGYPIIIKDKSINRAELMNALEVKGVECRPLFGCIPTQQPAYSYLANKYSGRLPNAEWLGARGFYIGCHQFLERDDLNYVAQVFGEVLT